MRFSTFGDGSMFQKLMFRCTVVCVTLMLLSTVPGSVGVGIGIDLRTPVTMTAKLSNTQLPLDNKGEMLKTGEAAILVHNNTYYLYMNDWGGCPGVDCCDSADGCASCCFNPPSARYPDACVYTSNHTVRVYATRDFSSWENLGEALPLTARLAGVEFRPQVVFNAKTKKFVMWYEDRHTDQKGYAVALSDTPQGPFVTLEDTVVMPGAGRVGDHYLFVDDDGAAYHVRTGFDIVALDDTYTKPTSLYSNFSTPLPAEGPVLFKRQGVYYIAAGVGCCACIGGSNLYVFSAPSPLGPWELQGDVGSVPGHNFDKHSKNNYVSKAQMSAAFVVPVPTLEYKCDANPALNRWDAAWSSSVVMLGNQWVTATSAGHPRNQDLLFWTVLQFGGAKGTTVQQLVWHDSIEFPMPVCHS